MNNEAIPQLSAANLYVVHSVKEKNEKKQLNKEEITTPAPSSQRKPYQYNNRSYYYDSTGGGYKGL
jgi:hypothetical protein